MRVRFFFMLIFCNAFHVSSVMAQQNVGASEVIGTLSSDLTQLNENFDPSCRDVRSVPIVVNQPLPNYLEVDKVRRAGIKRAGELAIEQVIGLKIVSRSEAETSFKNDVINNKYEDSKVASSGGLVRYKLNSEEILELEGNKFIKIDLTVTVCIPKTEEQIAKEEAERIRKANPPKRILSEVPQFFNTATGEPIVWYWRSSEGEFEFFDNSGFHPLTGDALYPVTKLIADEWRRTAEARRERTRREAEEQQKARTSGERCDQYAANPNDLQRPRGVIGVEYGLLKANAAEAIEACGKAVDLFPSTPRFFYQLGRAWQSKDRKQAYKFLKKASDDGYLAALDNIGWLLINDKKIVEGRQMFSTGADRGDPSCMYSLGTLLEKDARAKQSSTDMQKAVRLYQKSAALGHSMAGNRLQELVAEEQELSRRAAEASQRDRLKQQQDEQTMRLFLGVVGAILQNR